jgi:hypothetical protein
MRKYRQVVEFANFICHFGNDVLLDYLNEIVLPAFLSGHRVRMYGNSKYLFLDVKLVNLKSESEPGALTPALIGRFVMDTELQRDQILVDNKIVPDTQKLKSAPSSLFVLLLDNHKLIYSKQVSGAPGLSAFRTTAELILKWRWREYINELVEKNKAAREAGSKIPKITKRALVDSIQAPRLEIVPLAGSQNLTNFVNQFKVLKEINIKVVRPNAEINNDGLFTTVEAARSQVNADATSLIHRNSEGLNKAQSIKQIGPAMQGNALVTLRGTGPTDAKLVGTNEEMSVREPMDVPPSVSKGSVAMFSAFKRLIFQNVLQVGKVVNSERNLAKLESLKNGS